MKLANDNYKQALTIFELDFNREDDDNSWDSDDDMYWQPSLPDPELPEPGSDYNYPVDLTTE